MKTWLRAYPIKNTTITLAQHYSIIKCYFTI